MNSHLWTAVGSRDAVRHRSPRRVAGGRRETIGEQASGEQHFDGVIVSSGRSGVREVVSSVIVGRGVVRGVGRIIEIDSLPTDPENVNRDRSGVPRRHVAHHRRQQ